MLGRIFPEPARLDEQPEIKSAEHLLANRPARQTFSHVTWLIHVELGGRERLRHVVASPLDIESATGRCPLTIANAFQLDEQGMLAVRLM